MSMVVSKKSFGLWIFIFLFFLLVVGPKFGSAFLSGWAYRQPITIHNANSNALTDFQVRIVLNSSNVGSNFNWTNDEDSIRFTDTNDNLLNYWIESYNTTTDEAIIWVNVTSIPANSDATIYLYYHNPQLSDYEFVSNGLVAWYKLNGDAVDSSSNGYDGTNNGASPTTDRFGNNNSAMSFDGSSDYVEVPSDSYDHSQSYTISGWFKSNVSKPSARMVLFDDIANGGYYTLTLRFTSDSTGHLELASYDGSYSKADTSDDFSSGWHFFTVVYDDSKAELFVDGVFRISLDNVYLSSQDNFFIGSSGSQYFFNGDLDDFRIYDRALSQSEIEELYHNSEYYSGDKVFEFFDDFSEGSLNTSMWGVINLYGSSGGGAEISNGKLNITAGNQVRILVYSKETFPIFKYEMFFQGRHVNDLDGDSNGFEYGFISPNFDASPTNKISYSTVGSSWKYYNNFAINYNNTQVYKSTDQNDYINFWSTQTTFADYGIKEQSGRIIVYKKGTIFRDYNSSSISTEYNSSIGFQSYESGLDQISWVFVRKYASQEPTTTFGGEQTGTTAPTISIDSPANGAVLYNSQATNILLVVEGHNLNATHVYSCEYQLCDYDNPTNCFPFIPFDNLTSSHNATTSLYPPLNHWSLNVTCIDQQNSSIVLSAKTSFSTNTKQKIFVINSWDNSPTQDYDFAITNTKNNDSLSLSSTKSEQDSFPALGTYYYADFDSTSLMSDYTINYSDERFFPNNSIMYDVKFPYLNLTATTPLGRVWLGEFSTAPLSDDAYDGLLYVPTDNKLFHQQSPTSGDTYYGIKYLLNLSFPHNLVDAQGTFNKVSLYPHAHLYPSLNEIVGYSENDNAITSSSVVPVEPAYNPLSSSLVLNGNDEGVLCADCGGQTISKYVDNTNYVSNTQTINAKCDGLSQNLTTTFNQYYGKYNFIVLNEKDNSPFIINNTVLSGQVVCENKTIDLTFTNNTDDNVLVDCVPSHYNVFVDFNTTGGSMGRSYLMPAGEQTLTSYLINLYNTQAYKITFSFEGLENMNHPHISFENNQRVIMDSYPDLTYSITNYFLPNHEYSLVLYDGTEARSLGVVLADSSSTKIIRISPFTYQGTNPIYKDISVTYNITNSFIRVQYYDDLNETNSVAVTITRQNDSKILFSNIVYDSSLITFTYNGNITNDSVYIVNIDVNHKKYGKFSLEKALSIGKLIPLSFDNNTLTMFSIGIIIVSLLILGALGSLAIEIIALLGEIALFYAFGWLVISSALFGLIIGILIIALFGMFIKGGGL